MNNAIFTAADILLPPYPEKDGRWTSWGVIACDQFTSEIEYWDDAEKIAGDMSALSLILPEAYLSTEMQKKHEKRIAESMKTLPDRLAEHKNIMVYLERTLPAGKIRHGIVGKIDLKEYDYGKDSKSGVRATEETVVERIPPREAVRSAATVELPHVMLLIDDTDGIFS